MSNLETVWTSLNGRKKLIAIAASLAVFAAVLFMSRGANSTDMSLLYAGLDNSAAGEVVTALDQRGIAYDVRGTSIFVPSIDRDALRMTLASEGLPTNSSQGYELLDSLSGFGTTSQMFDAAYWRAKEGELARTMLASPHIRAARVHISATSAQPFRREQAPTAAVNVTTVNGMLDMAQADALRYLVASAVPGLAPMDVAVIDGVGGLISGPDAGGISPDTQERTTEIRTRVERLLTARVGPGNAVVEVSVDTVLESESIIERRFDPETRVAISTDVQESNTSSQDSGGGDVTIASNLPDGDAAGAAGTATNENSESRSVTNYEVSETQREILRAPGAIKRITVAVLVNDVTTLDDTGAQIVTPRPAEELEDLRELVASAVGFDAERGDDITIRSMAFDALPVEGTDGQEPVSISAPLNMMRLIQTGVLAVVALILGLFVVRPILTSSNTSPALLDNSGRASGPALVSNDGSIIEGSSAELSGTQGAGAVPGGGNAMGTIGEESPVERLRELIDDRRDEAIQVLQSWIDEPKVEGSK